MIAYIHWNVDPEIIHLKGVPFRYYSLMFCLAFLTGERILQNMFVLEKMEAGKLHQLIIYIAVGTLLGARLGHCLFYDWQYYHLHIAEIFLPFVFGPGLHYRFTGYQGLASHGGAMGILLAVFLYCRKYKVSIYWLLDRLVIVCALAGFFIRLGNLFNSEIIGTPARVPWAFVFERVDSVPRHPAQLYEAFSYLVIFFILFSLYKSGKHWRGHLFSLFLILIFLTRLTIEFWKQNQSPFEDEMRLDMGQILSLPFILTGIIIQIRIRQRLKKARTRIRT